MIVGSAKLCLNKDGLFFWKYSDVKIYMTSILSRVHPERKNYNIKITISVITYYSTCVHFVSSSVLKSITATL